MTTTVPASTGPPTLQRNAVGTFGALAQSLGAISPAGTVAVMGALIVPLAGTGTWLTVLFQMVVVLCTGWIIIRLARRFATTGGLYGLNSRCAGRLGGVLTALAIVFIGLAALPAMVVVFANYTASFFNLFGMQMTKPVLAGFCVLGAVLAAFFSYKEIKLSVMVMLVLQALSIAAMVLLFSIVLAHAPHIFGSAQFGLHGVTVQGLALGMVIGIFAYEGFESATVFGQEARNPNHVIPRAVVGSLVITGLLFTFAGYSLVLGYNGHLPALIASPNPLTDLANRNGVHWLSYLVDIGIIVATFAVIIATINLVARVVFTLARERLLPPTLARVGRTTKTPVLPIILLAGFGLALALWVVSTSSTPVVFTGPFFTLAGFFAIAEYFIVSIGGAVYLARIRDLHPLDVIAGVISAGGMAYVLYSSYVPFPPYPDSIIAWMFLAIMVAGGVTYAVLRGHPQILDRIGRSVADDTALVAGEAAIPETVPPPTAGDGTSRPSPPATRPVLAPVRLAGLGRFARHRRA
jgi:amino acid transporter